MDGTFGDRVELRHLRAFETVARLSSFTHAADELTITQPALSRTVRQLEDILGVTLLDRSSRRVEPSGPGRVFLDHVERILAELEAGLHAVRRRASIRLGFGWLLPDPWAQQTVAEFERATEVTVDLVRTDDALAAVTHGQVDVAVVRGRLTSTAVRAMHLFDEQRVAVCSARSALADRSALDWNEIPRWPMVVNVVGGSTGPWSWPTGGGPTTVVETTNYDEWIETIAADRGIGVTGDVAVRRNIHPGVRFITLRDAPPSPVLLIFPPNSRSVTLRRFIETSAAVAAGCRP